MICDPSDMLVGYPCETDALSTWLGTLAALLAVVNIANLHLFSNHRLLAFCPVEAVCGADATNRACFTRNRLRIVPVGMCEKLGIVGRRIMGGFAKLRWYVVRRE